MSFQSKELGPKTQTVSKLFKIGVITVLKLSTVLTHNNAPGLPNGPQTHPHFEKLSFTRAEEQHKGHTLYLRIHQLGMTAKQSLIITLAWNTSHQHR